MEYKFEFDAFYDSGLGRMYCEDFENGCTGAYVVNPTDGYYAVFESEESAQKPYFTKTQLRKLNKPSLLALCEETFAESFPDLDCVTRAELEDELLALTYEEFIALYGKNNCWGDIDYYDFIAHGYRQGEAVKVVNADNQAWLACNYIERLFFDSPIVARCYVYYREDSDDAYNLVSDLYLGDYMADCYEWDRSAMVDDMKTSSDTLVRMAAYVLESNPDIIDKPTY